MAFDKDPFAEWWLRATDDEGEISGWIAQLAKDAGVDKITDAEYITAQYDAELAYLDDYIVELFDALAGGVRQDARGAR